MTFEDLLEHISQDTGVNFHEFLHSNGFHFVYQNQWRISIEFNPDSHSIHVYTPIDKITHYTNPAIIEKMLSAHLFGQQTFDSYFGFSPTTNDILLFKSIPLHQLDYIQFANHIENFTNTLETWQGILDSPILKL